MPGFLRISLGISTNERSNSVFLLLIKYDGNRIRYSRIWHDPVIFPVIAPLVLSPANQND